MLLKKIIMFLLLMPIGALVGTGLTIIWAMIVQWFLDKWNQEEKMWVNKEFLNFIYKNNNEMEIVGNIYQNLELYEEVR